MAADLEELAAARPGEQALVIAFLCTWLEARALGGMGGSLLVLCQPSVWVCCGVVGISNH